MAQPSFTPPSVPIGNLPLLTNAPTSNTAFTVIYPQETNVNLRTKRLLWQTITNSIPGIAAGGQSGQLQFNNAGVLGGVTNGTLQAHTNLAQLGWPIYNVKNFGAVGNGSTDDTTAIQATLNAVQTSSQPGTVYIPVGTYRTTAALAITNSNVKLVGDGLSSIIRVTTSGISNAILVNNASARLFNISIDGIRIEGTNGLAAPPDGITFKNASEIFVNDFYGYKLQNGIQVNACEQTFILNSTFSTITSNGVYSTVNDPSGFSSSSVWLQNCNIYQTTNSGWLIDGASGKSGIHSCWIESTPVGIKLQNRTTTDSEVDTLSVSSVLFQNLTGSGFEGGRFISMAPQGSGTNYFIVQSLSIEDCKVTTTGASNAVEFIVGSHTNSAIHNLSIRNSMFVGVSASAFYSDDTASVHVENNWVQSGLPPTSGSLVTARWFMPPLLSIPDTNNVERTLLHRTAANDIQIWTPPTNAGLGLFVFDNTKSIYGDIGNDGNDFAIDNTTFGITKALDVGGTIQAGTQNRNITLANGRLDYTQLDTNGAAVGNSLIFTNNAWTLLSPGGGSALTVRDEDGTPTEANVNTIRVSNGSLVVNGAGDVSITTGGGGGTVLTAIKYGYAMGFTNATLGFGQTNDASVYGPARDNLSGGTNVTFSITVTNAGTYEVWAYLIDRFTTTFDDAFKIRNETAGADVTADFWAISGDWGRTPVLLHGYVTTATANNVLTVFGRSLDTTYASHYIVASNSWIGFNTLGGSAGAAAGGNPIFINNTQSTDTNGLSFTNSSKVIWRLTATGAPDLAEAFPTNLVNADIDAAAAIARSKLASGTANHVLINDGSGVMSSEATLGAARFPALTGDVTTPGGSLASTIANNAVSNTKAADMAEYSVKAKPTTGTGDPTDMNIPVNTVLGRVAGDVVAAQLATAQIANDAVTYAKMQNIATTQRALGRNTAGAGDTEEVTLSQLLDWIGSAAQGDILYRGAATWARLGAGTSGQFLQTQGAAANPQWATPAGSGDMSKAGSNLVTGTVHYQIIGAWVSGTNLFLTPTTNIVSLTLATNIGISFTNWTSNTGWKELILFQDGTGGRTIAWESTTRFWNSTNLDFSTPPAFNTNAGAGTKFEVGNIGGTNWVFGGDSADSWFLTKLIGAGLLSAELDTQIQDDTGSGLLVFATSPTLTTPVLGAATFTSLAETGDAADAGALRLLNASVIGWEASPAGTDVTLTVDSSEVMQASGTFNAATLTEGGVAVFNSGETPGGELGGTWASPTVDDSLSVATWTMTGAPGLTLANGTTSAGVLRIDEDDDDGANYVEQTVAALAANRTITWRDAAGTPLLSGDTLTGEVTATFDTDGSTATTIADSVTVATWTMTGAPGLTLANGTTSSGVLRIDEDDDNGANYAEFQVPALGANTVYTLPPDDGDAGEQLTTDGNGVLTWEAPGAGGSGDAITVLNVAATDPDFTNSTTFVWLLDTATTPDQISGYPTNLTAAQLATDSVSADELNATGVEAELESALDIGGEVTSTGMASTVIGDSISVATWTMTGAPGLTLANAATSAGVLRIDEDDDDGANYVEQTVAALAANRTITWRDAAGTPLLSGDTLTGEVTATFDTDGSTATTIADSVTVATWTMTGTAGLAVNNGATGPGAIDFFEDSDNGANRTRVTAAASVADNTLTLPDATDTLVGKATTDTLTGKTYDAAGTGNVLKFTDYKDFVYPAKVDGTGCTILTNDYSSPLWGLATFNGTGETNANWSFFRLGVVPLDLDTSVELVIKNLAVRVSATDADAATLDFGLFSPASSAGHAPTAWSSFSTFIRASVTPSTPAAEDIFYFADITLTGWAAGVTAGRPMIIGIARLNTTNDDSITVVSGTVEYTRTK